MHHRCNQFKRHEPAINYIHSNYVQYPAQVVYWSHCKSKCVSFLHLSVQKRIRVRNKTKNIINIINGTWDIGQKTDNPNIRQANFRTENSESSNCSTHVIVSAKKKNQLNKKIQPKLLWTKILIVAIFWYSTEAQKAISEDVDNKRQLKRTKLTPTC